MSINNEVVPSTGSSLMALLPMVIIFAIFYFFLIRPQLRRQKELEKTISEIKKGDKVLAAGGIYGVVSKIEDNILSLEIAENTSIKVAKSSVTEVIKNSNAKIEAVETKKVDKKAKEIKPVKAKKADKK